MKKMNSVSEFTSHRNTHLLEQFRKTIAERSRIEHEKVFRHVSTLPSPRFWVSEQRAAVVIGKMVAGKDPTALMTPEKRRMYLEIYARFIKLRRKYPDESIAALVFEVINSEAPCQFMSWETVRSIIYREQRKARRERREA